VLTERRAADREQKATRDVVVVIPIPNDPDWSIFDEISEDVPIIVIDDSDGKLAPAPRANVRFFDYAAQERVMGRNYRAQSHKSAATRNFGHYLAYQEGADVIIALDYDCRPRPGWLARHTGALGAVSDAPAVSGAWINSIEQPGFYARGYPYEYRNEHASAVTETVATGTVKVNMGVWENVLDLNGVDKVQRDVAGEPVPTHPGLRGAQNYVALGNIPVCGMNTAFTRDLVPAYFFLPDLWIDGWQLSRHDDIWGGYVLKRLMDKRGDLFRYGTPIVEHTRQSNLQRAMVFEQYMHLMARQFFELVDDSAARIRTDAYAPMFGAFAEAYLGGVERTGAPLHYQRAYRALGEAMVRWAECFR